MGKVVDLIELRVAVPRSLNDASKLRHPDLSAAQRITVALRRDVVADNPDLVDAAQRDYVLLRCLLATIRDLTAKVDEHRGILSQRGFALLLESARDPDNPNRPDLLAAAGLVNASIALSDALIGAATNTSRLLDLDAWRRQIAEDEGGDPGESEAVH